MVALAVEISASRLIGNVYGSSNLVWASVIGLILVYLTLGYWLGGKAADKHPNYHYFYTILLWGSLAVGLIPLVSRPILRLSSNLFDQLRIGLLAGSFITIIILFILPVTLIGMASPFALKLALKDTSTAGKISGKISAISTLGSFIGTFLPVLVLIPLIGTYRTFLFFSSLLMLVSIIGFVKFVGFKHWLRFSWMPLVLLMLWIFGVKGADKATQNLIYETESSYNYIQVIAYDEFRFLRLNEGQGVHSIYHPTQLNYFGPWSQVLVAPYFNQVPHRIETVEKMALVGLAAGTTARQANAVYDLERIDGFEIDQKIVNVGRDYFDMNQSNLEVYIQDGRWGLTHSDEHYDIISIDAYRPPYIPWHLTTLEFFKIVNNQLTDEGVMVINIGRSPFNRTLVNDLGTTISEVFPTIFVMDVPDSFNTILFATKQPGSWDNFINNFVYLSENGAPQFLLEIMTLTIDNRQLQPVATRVYTDDLTPIEWVTNNIVLGYLFSGSLGDLE
jgi:spermidine synthase